MGRNYDDQYLERDIESHFVNQVKLKLKGSAQKFSSPNKRSVPDRIVILPSDLREEAEGAIIVFVELKATGKRPTQAQEREHARLRKIGAEVFIIDHKAGTDEFIEFMLAGKKGGTSTQYSVDWGFIV